MITSLTRNGCAVSVARVKSIACSFYCMHVIFEPMLQGRGMSLWGAMCLKIYIIYKK